MSGSRQRTPANGARDLIDRLVEGWAAGRAPSSEDALALAGVTDLGPLLEAAAALRDEGFGGVVTFSKKIFLPLTHLCRDICHYCVFARPPRRGEAGSAGKRGARAPPA